VMAGKREVAENFFVEPSTGRCFACDGSPYEGIEFIWNHTNLWVNMQAGTINGAAAAAGAAAAGLGALSWDLKNTDKWEFVLETTDPLESLRVEDDQAAGGVVEERLHVQPAGECVAG